MANGADPETGSPHDAQAEPGPGAAADEDAELEESFKATAGVLDKGFGRPGAADDISMLLDRRLPASGFTSSSYDDINAVLEDYLGEEPAGFIWWLADEGHSFAARIQIASRHLSEQSIRTLRFLFGRHGNELRLCLRLSQVVPDDWRTVTRTTWYNRGNGRDQIRFVIIKNNDEVLKLDCAPDSLLQFIRILMDSLQSIPNVGGYFSEQGTSEFHSSVSALSELMEEKAGEEVPA